MYQYIILNLKFHTEYNIMLNPYCVIIAVFIDIMKYYS